MQGLDTEDSVPAPKVVEALLGTRFQGRDFVKGPLVRQHPHCGISSHAAAALHLLHCLLASSALQLDKA